MELKIFFILSILLAFFLFGIIGIRKLEKGWLLYPLILAFMPFYNVVLFQRLGPNPAFTQILLFFPFVMLVMVMCFLWFQMNLRKSRGRLFEKGPLFYPMLFWIGTQIFSLVVARDIVEGITIICAWIFIFISYLAMYNTIKNTNTIKDFVYLYIAACTFLAIFGMYRYFIVGDSPVGVNPFRIGGRGILFENNSFGIVMEEALFLPVMLYMCSKAHTSTRILCLLSSAIILIATIYSFSRQVWVSLAATLLFMVFVFNPGDKFRMRLSAIFLLVILLGASLFYIVPGLKAQILTLKTGSAYQSRKYWMIAGANCFLHHPILGVGVDNFDEYYIKRFVPPGWWAVTSAKGKENVPSLYLRTLVETGILGFTGLMWVIIAIYRELNRKMKALEKGSFEKAMSMGFLLGCVAHFFHFLITAHVWPAQWLYFWFAVTLVKVTPSPKLRRSRQI